MVSTIIFLVLRISKHLATIPQPRSLLPLGATCRIRNPDAPHAEEWCQGGSEQGGAVLMSKPEFSCP